RAPRLAECVAFSPNGERVACAGRFRDGAGEVKVWDLRTGACVWSLRGQVGGVRSVAFSPDGKRLATAGDDGTVRIYALEPDRAPRGLRGPPAGVVCGARCTDTAG